MRKRASDSKQVALIHGVAKAMTYKFLFPVAVKATMV